MIVCIAGQPSSADYLAPLMPGLQQAFGACKVLASSEAYEQFNRRGMASVDVQAVDRNYLTVQTALATFKPALVLSSLSLGFDLERFAVRWCKENSVPVVQFFDYWSNIAGRVMEHARNPAITADLFIAIDLSTQRSLIAHGIPSEKIVVGGQPAWDRLGPFERFGPLRKVLIVTQPIRHFYGETLGYTEDDVIEGALSVLEERSDEISDVCLSRHPLESSAAVRSGLPLRHVSGHALDELEGASLVIGAFSSVLPAALLRGVRCVRFQPNRSTLDPDGPEHQDLVPLATDERQLRQFLNCYPPLGVPFYELLDAVQGSKDGIVTILKEVVKPVEAAS